MQLIEEFKRPNVGLYDNLDLLRRTNSRRVQPWAKNHTVVSAGPVNPILTLSPAFYVDGLITAPTTSGANVTGWTDLSSNGRTLNSTSATKPQLIDTVGIQLLAANSTYLRRTGQNIIGTGGYCLGIVLKIDANIDGEIFFGNADASAGGVNLKINTTTFSVDHYNAGLAVRDDTNVPSNTSVYNVFIVDRSGSGVAPVIWRNGTNVSGFSQTVNPTAAGANADIIMGAIGNSVGSGFSSCRIKAAFMFAAGIGSTNVATIQAYWKAAYGTP